MTDRKMWSWVKVAGAAVALVAAGGCAAWTGDLGPWRGESAAAEGVSKRVREIGQTDLRARAVGPVKTVEEDMDSVRPRREVAGVTTGPTTREMPAGADRGSQASRLTGEATRDVGAVMRSSTEAATRPSAVRLTIGAVREEALRNNLDLAVVALDPAIARTAVSEERAKFDAVFTGGLGYKAENPPALNGPTVELDSKSADLDGQLAKLNEPEQTKDALVFDPGIEVPLPTGGKVKLRNVFEFERKTEPLDAEQYVSGLKFSVSQPLLRGAGVRANVGSIRVARLGERAAEAKAKLSAIRVLALAEKAYWNVYAARRALDVRAQQYQLAYDNLELVRRRVAEGSAARIEEVRAEVGVTSRLEAVITARTQHRLQQRELKRILNIEGAGVETDVEVEVESSPELVKYELRREELVSAALRERMDLLEIELNLAADAIKVDLARNAALPLFTLDFDYGILDGQGSVGSSWGGMWDFDNTGFFVGVRGEIPVTNEARRARLRRALLGRTQRLATKAQREVAIRQEVHDTLDVLEQNWQRVLAARQNVIVSGTNYEAERAQFDEGLRTMREVLEALGQLGEAQLKEVQAVLAYQVAQIDIAFATGTLLGYAGVSAGPVGVRGVGDGGL